jgi:secreted Zn-dependent insulinase-like peptidase
MIADFQYRMKQLTVREFNEVLLEIFTNLLTSLDQIEPYYSQFREAAELQWNDAQSINYLKPQNQ